MIAAAHPPDEAERLKTLHALDLLDTPPEGSYDTLIDCAARLTGCPVALVSLVDERRQWFKAVRGLDTRETPREWAFCAHAILDRALLEVPDALADERFIDNPLVTGKPHIRFYAGAPLEHRGMPLGTLCVIDWQPRQLDDEQRELLTRLAAVAAELIDSRARLGRLREERERLADLSRASGDCVWELDAEYRYRWISGELETVTGLAPAALIGQRIADAPVLDADGSPRTDGATLHALLDSNAPLRRVVCAEHGPRGLLHVAHSALPMAGADGRPRGWRGSSRDISAQFAAEALRRDKEAAEQASRAKSEFLSRVSHELRTPLNGILGFAQLMALDADAPLAGEQRRRLDGVRAAGAHLLELIDELLDLARIEQQQGRPLALEPVDVGAALARCLALVRPLATAHRVELPERAPAPRWARAQPRALEQVLINLLDHAIKHNRAGGAVEVEIADDRPGLLRIAVRDGGSGLDAAQLAQRVQPFDPGAERRRVGGSGLGLVIARDLVEAMGGRFDIDNSRPGVASTYTVRLAACAAPDDVGAGGGAPAAQPSPATTGAGAQVLYIEDEPLNVLLMQEVFRSQPQWRLEVAIDGTRGLEMARALRPDLLLIDMNLPDIGGLELIGRLRGDPATAGIPCIALSADAMREQIELALAAGFDDYWTKPIDIPRLIGALAERLQRAGGAREPPSKKPA